MPPMPFWKPGRPTIDQNNDRPSSSSRLHQYLDAVLAAPSIPVNTDNKGFQLRDFQADAIDAVLNALVKDKLHCIGVSAPPGSGKTTILTTLIPLIPKLDEAHKVLIIVPSVHLILQTENTIRERFPKHYQIGFEQRERTAHQDNDIVIGTWQSLQYPARISRYHVEDFKAIIVDEAHHAPAGAFLKVLHYFNDRVNIAGGSRPLAKKNHGHQVPIIGFSATFARTDLKYLSWTFEKAVYHLGLEELLAKQLLAEVEIKSAWSEIQELWSEMQDRQASGSPIRTIVGSKKTNKVASQSATAPSESSQGDFTEMWKITRTHEFNARVVKTYQQEAQGRKSTLVFCANLAVMRDLTAKFKVAGIEAESVSTKTPQPKRVQIIDGFKQLKLPLILNCEVFREGADLPSVDCIILANPTSSQNMFSQMIGRGFRLSPSTGKTACLILDLFGICSRFSLSVEPSLEGKKPPKKKQRTAKKVAEKQ